MEKDENIKGIKIEKLNRIMMIICTVVFICLIANILKMPQQYTQFIQATKDYTQCENDSATLSLASDYLTEQVRLFVINGDLDNMNNYFQEVNITKRREKAIEELKTHDTSESTQNSILLALNASNELMNQEIHAMKLISFVYNYDQTLLANEVASYVLPEEELQLSNEQKEILARNLVFDKSYQDVKNQIKENIDAFNNSILATVSLKEESSQQIFKNHLVEEGILIGILFIMNIITFAAVTILVIKPLIIHIKHIKENDLLEIIGSFEFKYLALTYNSIYELNAINQANLEREASHDALTGLLNRGSFNHLALKLEKEIMPLAFMMLDIDDFKHVNDTYGHEVGDQALIKVAQVLKSEFRSSDYVIRLGGDEFAVIMTKMTKNNEDVIGQKIKSINDKLLQSDNSVPTLSLSVGVAFSLLGFNKELYNQADQALYFVKKNGKKAYRIYEKK